MKRLLDKLFLYIIGLILIVDINGFTTPVVVSVVSFSLSCLSLYFEKENLHGILHVLFAVLCFMIPEFLFFLPLMLYDAFMEKQFVICVSFLSMFINLPIFEGIKLSYFVLACALSLYLTYRTTRLEASEQMLISLRDSSKELNDSLRQKNKDLMEKQDYEVHLATLQERNRIAREIHDNVGHMLSRSILQMGALTTIYKEDPLNAQLKSINESLNSAMNSIRESVHDLHDDSIDLRQSANEILESAKDKFQFYFDYDMSLHVPRNIKYCFITVLKEAVSNAVKHCNGDRITVILREHPAFYQMSIEDNGTNILKDKESGIGLTNMQDRVEALDGTFHIQTERGFHIFISIPKKENA